MSRQSVILILEGSRNELSVQVLSNLKDLVDFALKNSDWDIQRFILTGCANVTWARNMIVSQALRMFPDAETFILWDSDQVGLSNDAILKLLEANVDIVGTLIPSKWNVKIETHFDIEKTPKIDLKNGDLIELVPGDMRKPIVNREFTGAGVVAVKTRVFKGIADKKFADSFIGFDEETYDFFCHITVPVEVEDKKTKEKIIKQWVLIEEFAFFTKAYNAGYRLFIDPTIKIGHIGRYIYTLADIGEVKDGKRKRYPIQLNL